MMYDVYAKKLDKMLDDSSLPLEARVDIIKALALSRIAGFVYCISDPDDVSIGLSHIAVATERIAVCCESPIVTIDGGKMAPHRSK